VDIPDANELVEERCCCCGGAAIEGTSSVEGDGDVAGDEEEETELGESIPSRLLLESCAAMIVNMLMLRGM
jgi:hypothetical protein